MFRVVRMAKAEPLSLLQFQKNFGTEEDCANYIFFKRWSDGFACPRCCHDQYYFVETRKLFRRRSCSYQASVTAGTIMHKSKLPMTMCFWAIYLVAHDKRDKSALSLSHILGINYRTALRLLRKIREAMRERDENYLLSDVVEMDDAYFGVPSKGKDGRGTNRAKAVIALSKDHKNRSAYLRIKVVDKATAEEIVRVARECVKAGSKIVSDGHSSYKRLVEHGLLHEAKSYYREDKDTFQKDAA
jgi:transposase-like protein